MAKAEMLRPYVEKVVAEYLGQPEVKTAPDGTIPIRQGTTAYFVSLLDMTPPILRVHSLVLRGVDKSEKLLDKLNEMNPKVPFVKIFWLERDVVIAYEILAETAEKNEIANACTVVATVADHFDEELKAAFGGEVWFAEAATEAAKANEQAKQTPGYA